MTSVFHLINNKYSSLSRSERTVAEYILQNPAAVMLLSMRGLAEKINLSDNTVLRFCRTCGFSGYLDFKTALLPQVVTENGSIYKQVDTRDRFTLQREKISKNLSTTIGETYGNTREEEITLVARRIAASQHTYLVGLAPSVGVARIFADSLRGDRCSQQSACRSNRDREDVPGHEERIGADRSDTLLGFAPAGLSPASSAASLAALPEPPPHLPPPPLHSFCTVRVGQEPTGVLAHFPTGARTPSLGAYESVVSETRPSEEVACDGCVTACDHRARR